MEGHDELSRMHMWICLCIASICEGRAEVLSSMSVTFGLELIDF